MYYILLLMWIAFVKLLQYENYEVKNWQTWGFIILYMIPVIYCMYLDYKLRFKD